MFLRTTALCTSVLCVAGPATARIDTLYCEPRETLREILVTEYGAHLTGQGVRGPDVILEIWTAPESGDWTLVQSYANGQACVVAMGDSWEALTAPPDES